jgi:arsenite methyltransferase
VQAPASHLVDIDDEAVDAVTLRSVTIYEPDKATAFAEFYQVLRPGGRLSLLANQSTDSLNSLADTTSAQ